MSLPLTRHLALAAALAVALPAAAAPAPHAPRSAIVVGAMAPVAGRAVLKHAHHDAETMRDVLLSVGGFEPAQVHVLRDPEPGALLALVTREAAALAGVPQGMLFFYYSGHADQAALWSAGQAVSIESLRAALDRPGVSLRVGVLDACQGGGWTRAKGLTPDAPFEVTLPALLSSEGSALISSSSGAESAHESDSLRGSFFTHHFAAALRGAADERRAGEVTLTEAFEYARQQTIRETARRAAEPQHPSFALNLKGRQDVVLAQIAQAPSALSVEQADGPVELVHLGSGLRLLELPPGRRQVTVAVPPGTYLVRKVAAAGVMAREVVVPPTGSARVSEADLVLVGSERMVLKGSDGEATITDWPAAGHGEVSLGLQTARDGGSWPAPANVSTFAHPGVGTGEPVGRGSDVRLDGRYGLTDRLLWKMGTAAFAYRLGEPDRLDVILSGGLLSWRLPLSSPAVERNVEGYRLGEWEARVGAGAAFRFHFKGGAVILSGDVAKARVGYFIGSASHIAIGLSLDLGRSVTVHLALASATTSFPAFEMVTPLPDGSNMFSFGGGERGWTLVGSAQEVGLTTLPLVRYSPHGTWALDLYSTWGQTDGRTWRSAHRLGVSRAF